MITDEELADLPSDPELAFVAFEKIVRERLLDAEARAPYEEFNPDPFRVEYMTRVLAAAKQYDIQALGGLKMPRASAFGRTDMSGALADFKADVDFVTTQIRLHAAQVNREGSVALDRPAKRHIRELIEQIRVLIEEGGFDEDRREELLIKLDKFALDVDRSRTKFQSAGEFFVAVCDYIGQGFDKLKPVRELLDSIGRIMGHAKQLEEHYTPKLPGPTERKKLEPPPSPTEEGSIDDDIPF